MNVPLMCATLTVLLVSNGLLWLALRELKKDNSELRTSLCRTEDWCMERTRNSEKQVLEFADRLYRKIEQMNGEAKTNGNGAETRPQTENP